MRVSSFYMRKAFVVTLSLQVNLLLLYRKTVAMQFLLFVTNKGRVCQEKGCFT